MTVTMWTALLVQQPGAKPGEVPGAASAVAPGSKDERVAHAYRQFEQQRHVDAALEFEGLWKDFKEPRFLFNAAVSRYAAKHAAHAVAYLTEYLALSSVQGEDRTEAQAQLEVARREVASVAVAVTVPADENAVLTVRVDWVSEYASDRRPPLLAEIAASPSERRPAVLQLDPGVWKLSVQHAGYEPVEKQVRVALGSPPPVQLQLRRVAVATRLVTCFR